LGLGFTFLVFSSHILSRAFCSWSRYVTSRCSPELEVLS